MSPFSSFFLLFPSFSLFPPTGTITFREGGTVLGSGSLEVVGGVDRASLTIASLSVGSHEVQGEFAGDLQFRASRSTPVKQTVNQADTTTTVSASPNPTSVGKMVTLLAVVSPVAPGAGTPTGMVRFLEDGQPLANVPLQVVNGQAEAEYQSDQFKVGDHTIEGIFGGDVNFGSSKGMAILDPYYATYTDQFYTSPHPIMNEEPTTFSAVVAPQPDPPGLPTPTGTIAFFVEDDLFNIIAYIGSGTVDSHGVASCTVDDVPDNAYYYEAFYTPDAGSPMYGGSNSDSDELTILPWAPPPNVLDNPPPCNCPDSNADLVGLAFGADGVGPPAPSTANSNAGSDSAFSSPSEYSAFPVRYFDGVVKLAATDLASNGFGVPWGVTRSWTNGPNALVPGLNGNGWVDTQLPTVRTQDNGNIIQVILNGTQDLYFTADLDDNGLIMGNPLYNESEYLVYNPSTGILNLIDTRGDRLTFSAPANPAYSLFKGTFIGYQDANGSSVTANLDGDGRPVTIQRSAVVNGATVYETYVYSYVPPNTPAAGSIAGVSLQRGSGNNWTTIQTVTYTYYGTFDPNGTYNDLKTAVITDGAGNVLSTDYYRYYVAGDPNGYAGGLKYVLSGDSYLRAAAALGDPTTASDAALMPFVDNYFQYDSDHRVSQEVAQAAGSSASGGGLGTFTYAYTRSSNPPGISSWSMKTVETLPDGVSQNIVYTNAYGQPLLKVALGQQEWLSYFQYDTNGRLILSASPSAVSNYSELFPDLVIDSAGVNHYLNTGSGLITRYNYATITTAGGSPGDVAGYLQSVQIQQGYNGTPITQESYQYFRLAAEYTVVYYLATDTVYRNPDSTGAETSAYDYEFGYGTFAPSSITVTYPTISSSQNGPGAADSETTVFDQYSNPIWHRDGNGFLDFTGYDPVTGAVVTSIQDVDTARTYEFYGLPTGWSTVAGGGANLMTQYDVDALGRTTEEIDPNDNITYTVYNDANREMIVYPGFNSITGTTTGPTQVYRDDLSGGYTEVLTMSALPHLTNGVPDGAEAISNLQTLTRLYTNAAGQIVEEDDYFNLAGVTYGTGFHIGTAGVNYYASQEGYDNQGRLNRTVTPTGTITRYVYDILGELLGVWVGTNDAGATDNDPSGGGTSGNNMVQVSGYIYDNGQGGDGDLTAEIDYPGGGAPPQETDIYYDWRDRPVARKSGVQSSEDTTTGRPLTYTIYDNLNEAVEQQTYDGDGVTITYTNGVPNAPDPSLLRADTKTSYDDQGRPYQQQVYSVDPSSGAVSGNALTTSFYYDLRGDLIATSSPGGLWTKQVFDGAGRLVVTYTTDGAGGTSWTAAASVANDTVLEQEEDSYDLNSNLVETVDRQRFDNVTGTGPLGSPTSGIGARDYYVGYYYDAADRPTAEVNVGTNGGGAWSRPGTVPTGSNTVLVTSYGYNSAGWVSSETDPAGNVTQTSYDNLGRVTQTIAAYTNGVPTASNNQTTAYTYDGDNHTLTIMAMLPGGTGQQTAYVYGTTTASGSAINSNDLLAAVEYPDPSSGLASASNKEAYTYNALGQVSTFIDRNGTTHAYGYDVLGRQVSDTLTTLGPGVDGSIRRIETAYNSQGLPYLYTSFDAPTGGNIVNQVEQVYNGLDQLTGEYQAHNGAVDTSSTPEVQYAYTEMAGGVNNSRLTEMIYLNGRILHYGYNSGLDDSISRLSYLADDDGSGNPGTVLEAYTYLGLGTVVQRAHPQTQVNLSYLNPYGGPTSDGGDQYTGLDRFGRVVDQFWKNVSSGSTIAELQYDYDTDSNRLYAANLVDAAFSQLYSYNPLQELTNYQQGTLNSTRTGLSGAANDSQSWGLDGLGNFTSVTTNGTTTTESANADNELTAVGSATPTYDSNGNLTTDANGNRYAYDGWNRLVQVTNSAGTVLVSYRYDALGRRIIENSGTARDLYYDANWNVIEEQVSGQTQIQYVWSPVAPDTLVLRDRDTTGDGTLDERLYAVQDANGNVIALVDTSGNVVERYAYQPYGAVTVLDGSWNARGSTAYGWQYLFQGGRYDVTVGLYDFRNRFYSPTLGRWLQQDPIGFGGGDVNLYRFVGNAPTNFTDPSGLQQAPLPPPGWPTQNPVLTYPAVQPGSPTSSGPPIQGTDSRYASLIFQARSVSVPEDAIQRALRQTVITAPGDRTDYVGDALRDLIATTSQKNLINYLKGLDAASRKRFFESLKALPPPPNGGGCSDEQARGPYSYLAAIDPTPIEAGKKFTPFQRDLVRLANEAMNGGNLRSDDPTDPYQELVWPTQRPKDRPRNEAQIDHIIPRARGGTNSLCNARVVSFAWNNDKSDD